MTWQHYFVHAGGEAGGAGDGPACPLPYVEVDMNVSTSTAALRALGVAKPICRSLVVDLAFLLEGSREDELPEVLLGCGRLVHVSLADGDVPPLV